MAFYKTTCKNFCSGRKRRRAIKLTSDAYKDLDVKEVYETFDFAEFLKNNEKFEKSIIYYTNVLDCIKQNHPLYSEATDGRGVAYERIGEWEKLKKIY